jgi:hypothetical protein
LRQFCNWKKIKITQQVFVEFELQYSELVSRKNKNVTMLDMVSGFFGSPEIQINILSKLVSHGSQKIITNTKFFLTTYF